MCHQAHAEGDVLKAKDKLQATKESRAANSAVAAAQLPAEKTGSAAATKPLALSNEATLFDSDIGDDLEAAQDKQPDKAKTSGGDTMASPGAGKRRKNTVLDEEEEEEDLGDQGKVQGDGLTVAEDSGKEDIKVGNQMTMVFCCTWRDG